MKKSKEIKNSKKDFLFGLLDFLDQKTTLETKLIIS